MNGLHLSVSTSSGELVSFLIYLMENIFCFPTAECSSTARTDFAASAVLWNIADEGQIECVRVFGAFSLGRKSKQEELARELVGGGQARVQ